MQIAMAGLRRKGRDLLRRLLRGGHRASLSGVTRQVATRGAQMNDSHSDRPLFFGTTRDLAHRKIFPAFNAMLERGRLDVTVIGTAQPDGSLVIQKHLFPLNHFSNRYGVEDGHIMLSVWAAAPLEPTRKGTFRRPSCPPSSAKPRVTRDASPGCFP